MLPEWTLAWLNSPWLPWIIFGGVMADAIIGVGFFVYGEVFFILAGFLLAGDESWAFLPAVWLSAWLGDLISYQVGRHYGQIILLPLLTRSETLRYQADRAMDQLQKKGHWAVLAARFLGPVSWITPFMAGTSHISTTRFALFSLLGVTLASTQFIAAGYLLANGINFYDEILAYLQAYPIPIAFAVICTILSVYLIILMIKSQHIQWYKLLMKLSMVWMSSFAVMNYGYFFIGNAHSALPVKSPATISTDSLTELNNLNFKVYAGDPKFNKAQPMNLVMITSRPLSEIHKRIGWVQNETFSGNSITFLSYIGLMLQGKPPVSDLYFQGVPQNYAFQATSDSDLVNRQHIRWWHIGKTEDQRDIYLGAVSLDNEIEVKPYKNIVTLLHDIAKEVDQSRERFSTAISETIPAARSERFELGTPVAQNDTNQDYWSDGLVTVIELM